MDQEMVRKIQQQDLDMEANDSLPGTRGEKGHGFGIRLVKHLVQTIDGKLLISSEKGEGTSIEIIIPLNADTKG